MPTQGKGPLGQAQVAYLRGGGGGGGEGSSSAKDIHRSSSLKKFINKAIVTNKTVKTLFSHKSKKPRSPVQVVEQASVLLNYLHSSDPDANGHKHQEKVNDLYILISEMKSILYGTSESEPLSESCSQLTQEFFKDDTFRLLISCLPKLDLEARKEVTQVVANLQRQPVNSQLIASKYLEENLDIINDLIIGYEDPSLALHYGGMLKECIRHQVVARYVLNSEQMKNFFDYIQLPNFDAAADAISTFKELMTRHKSTVAVFLSENYDWFFDEFNSKLLESTNYITRRQAVKLLGDILLDRSNSAAMVRYVSCKDNLRISMNLLRDPSKSIQIDTFHVFKLFVANQNKPNEICRILHINRGKLLRFFSNFKIDKEDEVFEADKAEVVRVIEALDQTTSNPSSGELFRYN